MVLTIIIAVAALIVGGVCGYLIFRYVLKGKYNADSTIAAAYNAGFGIVDTWLADREYSSDGKTLSYIPYSETAHYVEKVMASKRYYESGALQEITEE